MSGKSFQYPVKMLVGAFVIPLAPQKALKSPEEGYLSCLTEAEMFMYVQYR